jgi:hypothetical protein
MNRLGATKRIFSLIGLGTFILLIWLSPKSEVGVFQGISTSSQTTTPILTPGFFERNDNLISLFETLLNMENCILPCWWGLQPGISRTSDIRDFLEETGLEGNLDGPFVLGSTNALIGQGVYFNFVDISSLSSVHFYVDKMRLQWIYISLWLPGRWLSAQENRLEIPSILAEMDELPKVYIFTDSLRQIFLNDIGLTLLYLDEGVMLSYSFDIRDGQPQSSSWPLLRICPSMESTNHLYIWLQSADDVKPVSRFIRGLTQGVNYHPIEEILDIDSETFAQFFIDHPDSCLETSYIVHPHET